MTAPTVPDKPTKRADELKPGDWTIQLGREHVDFDGFGPAEVLSAHPFTSDTGTSRVMVVFAEAGYAGPQSVRIDAGTQVRLLTDAEVADQRADQARWQVSNDLHRLADLIVNHKLALPKMNVSVSFNVETIGEVRHVATSLGLELGPWNRGAGAATSWPRGLKSYDFGVHADWHCFSGTLEEPKPEPAPEPEPVGEHYFVSGSIGDPGQFSAECACGTTFSGFDSLDAATVELDRHIADPTGLTYSREADGAELVDETPATLVKTVDGRRAEHADGSIVELISTPDELVDETPDPNTACAEHDDAHLGTTCPDIVAKLADETPAEPWVAQFFTFGSGHFSESGEDLYGKYVAVIGPDRAACREAMVAKYGVAWSFQYDDLPPLSTLFEHDVIDLSATEPVSDPTGRGRESDPDWVAGFGPVPGSDLPADASTCPGGC